MDRPYPWPETTASACLEFIRSNPGCSQRAVVTHIGRNHVVVVKALAKLALHSLIEIVADDRGHKTITATGHADA